MKKLLFFCFISYVIYVTFRDEDKPISRNAVNSVTSQSTPAAVNKNNQAPPSVAPVNRIGEIIKTGKFEIQITKIEFKNSVGSDLFRSQAADGGVYVAIQWNYKNISQSPIGTFSTPTLRLVDGNGTDYSVDVGSSSSYATELNNDSKIFSDLNPGIRVKTSEVFEVGREQFDRNTWKAIVSADKKIQFSLN